MPVTPASTQHTARIVFCMAALVVLYFALAPVAERDSLTGWDKSNHAIAFGVLAVCGLVGWSDRVRAVVAGLVLYGLAIELLQMVTPDRLFDLRDLMADAVGIGLGWCVMRAWRLTARLRAAAARARRPRGG